MQNKYEKVCLKNAFNIIKERSYFMNKCRKLIAVFLCFLIIGGIFAGCAPQIRRVVPPTTKNPTVPSKVGQMDFTGRISASSEKADMNFGKITVPNLNVKSGPGTNFTTIGKVTSADKLNVYGKVDGWYIVKLPGQSSIGCVEGKYLKPYSTNVGLKRIPNVPSLTTPGTSTTPTTPYEPGTQGTPRIPGTPAVPKTPTPGTTTPPTTPGTTPTQDTAGTGVMTADEKRILDLCNAERAKAGAPALKANNDLTKLARMKSKDIVDKNYFSHESPTYGSPFEMMRNHGVSYMYAGENLAQNSTADKAFNAWMASEGHRKNILNPNFTELGVGIAPKGDGSFVYTQMFIGK